MTTTDIVAMVALAVFLVLFYRWGLHIGRETPKPKPPRRPMTDYERGYRAGWRRGIWFWW